MKFIRELFLVAGLGCVALPWLAAQSAAVASGRTLLLVDDALVSYRSGTYRVLHPAQRHAVNPVIAQDKPWELTIAYNTVYRDPKTGRHQMWYQAHSSKSPEIAAVCYAESMDGVRWEKPLLGLFKFGGKDTNMVIDGADGHYSASVVVDPRDADASRRYKMAFFRVAHVDGKKVMGLAVAFSPDGIHWTIHPKIPLLPGAYGKRADPPLAGDSSWEGGVPLAVSDVIDVMYDAPREVFAIYSKTWLDMPEGKMFWKRAIVRTESKDFIHWSKPQLVIAPDEFDGTGVEYRPPTVKVHPNRRGVQLHGGPTFLHHDVYFSLLHKMDGEITGQMPSELAVSRDGFKWQRLFRDRPFIDVDPFKNRFDSGCIWASSTPVILEDEIRFYYGAYSGLWNGDLFRKPSGVGLVSIRRDRFAGLKPIEAIGQVTLKPVDLRGVQGMTVNADATSGSVRVEVLSDGGFRIPGFTKEDAAPLTGDSLRHTVSWKGRTLRDLPPGRYQFRLHLENSEVFAVTLN